MITLPRRTLLSILSRCAGIADRRTTQNILSHALLVADGNALTYTATDFDIVLTGTVPCDAPAPVRLAVCVASMLAVVKALPDQSVTLRGQANHWVELTCGSSRFKLAGLPPDDFPEQKIADGLHPFRVPKRLLFAMVDRVAFSVSTDETRPSLNGAFLRVVREEDEVRMVLVSTDGHRLSRSEVLGGSALELPHGANEAIIHHRALGQLAKVLDGEDDTVAVSFGGGNVYFDADGLRFQARQLDETFPDYTKVIPRESKYRVELWKAEFVSAIKRVATMTSAKTAIIRFELVPDGGMVLSAQNPEAGEGRAEVPCEHEAAESMSVGFNYKYLLDVLGVIAGDTVRLSLSDQYQAGMITSADDEGSLFVVMPMRV